MSKIAGYPRWLTLSSDRTSFSLEPERASTIRRIFEMSRDGLGCYTIAKQLNEQKVPAFGTSGQWEQSTIDKMLRSRAVLGEHRPKGPVGPKRTSDHETNEVIVGFYPAAIDEALFDEVQRARVENGRTRRGRKGRLITNLFGKMVTCFYCQAPVRLHRGNAELRAMVCTTVLNAGNCVRFGWSYPDFERVVLQTIVSLDRENLLPLKTAIAALPTAHAYLGRQEVEKLLRRSVKSLRMASGGEEPRATSSNARIRRNQPGRFIEIAFDDQAPVRGKAV